MIASVRARPHFSLSVVAVLWVCLGSACGPRDEGGGAPPSGPETTSSGGDVTVGPSTSEPIPEPGALPRLESAHAIPDETTWRRLAARPATATVARTEVVKFLVDTQHDRTIWFVDTERWDIHFDFAVDRLGVPGGWQSHGDFNTREYRRPDRRFEMGSLVHYVDADLWVMEMVAGDNLSGERLVRMFDDVRRAVFFGDRLRFRPLSPQHEQTLATIPGRLPLVTADDVFRGVRYQPLTYGDAYGTLRIVRGPLDLASVRPDQILVLEDLPDEIPVVSGVVSQQLQAPLGHIAILCSTRGTPNMGLRDATSNETLRRLDGQLVRLTVAPQEWSVRPATRAEAEASWSARRPAQPLTPPVDARETRLRQVCDVRLDDVRTVGAKAAQLGEACGLGSRVRTPGGFTVPFHHYLAHLERAGVDRELNAMLGDASLAADPRALDARLRAIRERIQAAPVDEALLRRVRQRMTEIGRGRRFIFRSSTNAEDLPGFTGAGLYRSIVVPADASDAQVADAMREVWASVWLLGAFEERDWYRVDQRRVAMALLVQPFVDGAFANGVAITANPYFEGRPGFFVNAQALGGSVTGATGDEVPEQHLVYVYSEVVESELLSRSSRSPDALLLEEAQILQLASVLRTLHCHFRERWRQRGVQVDGSDALDVEYLVAGPDRHIVILQARPFEVRYDAAQRVGELDLCGYHPVGVE
ncbi:MAG: hypothetical protein OHK0013_25390 [Sandaracinaceae bacterium]